MIVAEQEKVITDQHLQMMAGYGIALVQDGNLPRIIYPLEQPTDAANFDALLQRKRDMEKDLQVVTGACLGSSKSFVENIWDVISQIGYKTQKNNLVYTGMSNSGQHIYTLPSPKSCNWHQAEQYCAWSGQHNMKKFKEFDKADFPTGPDDKGVQYDEMSNHLIPLIKNGMLASAQYVWGDKDWYNSEEATAMNVNTGHLMKTSMFFDTWEEVHTKISSGVNKNDTCHFYPVWRMDRLVI